MKTKHFFRRMAFAAAVAVCAAGLPAARAAAQDAGGKLAPELTKSDIKLRDDYTIVVNGEVLSPDVPPVELNGVIFVPIRFVGEALGAKIKWDAGKQEVQLNWDSSSLLLTIGKTEAEQDGAAVQIGAAPFLYGSRTMLPLMLSARAGGFTVKETEHSISLSKAEGGTAAGSQAPAPEKIEGAAGAKSVDDTLAEIRIKAKNDPITHKLKWFVLGMWGVAGALWLVRLIGSFSSTEEDRLKDKIVIALILGVGVPCVLLFMLSTYWAMMVPIVTCIVGLVSMEEYKDKLVTMANTAQGVGLICTLFGLGLLIGPAIANRDIHAIGYGIYVKIEPTITGLVLSIVMNMLYGYESRKRTTTG